MEIEGMISCVKWTKRNYALKDPIFQKDLNEEIEQEEEKIEKEEFTDDYPTEFDLEEKEKKDFKIKQTDFVLLAGKIEQDFSSLEVYIYDQKEENLFIHHDLILNSFPVCIEWLQTNFNKVESGEYDRGNIGVLGLMCKNIEIWDLDIIECVEPQLQLEGHSESITGLSLHQQRLNLLLSSSVDKTVKLWDIENVCIVQDLKHSSQIYQVKWSIDNDSQFIYRDNKQLLVNDLKSNKKTKFDIKCENFIQDPKNNNILYFCDDKGNLSQFDMKMNKTIKSVQIHKQEISGLEISNNKIITNSHDGIIKVLDMDFKELKQMNPKIGSLYDSSISPDCPTLYACGSSQGEVVIWDFQLIFNKNGNF